MLGYVVCDRGELLYKHHLLYQALYCGLCHSIKKNTTRYLEPFLSYDFVFLATVRLFVTGEPMQVEPRRCLLHPFSKKQRMKDNAALTYAAKASLLMTSEKMEDDRLDGDSSRKRRISLAFFRPILRRRLRRLERQDPQFSSLCRSIRDLLRQGRELEAQNADLDAMCGNFGAVLSALFSYGLEGNSARFCAALGDLLGRLIYTLDALEDWEKDETNNAFNPLLRQYGPFSQAWEHYPQMDLVLSFYLQEMQSILDLMTGDENLRKICENIIGKGLPGAKRKLMTKGEKNEQSI